MRLRISYILLLFFLFLSANRVIAQTEVFDGTISVKDELFFDYSRIRIYSFINEDVANRWMSLIQEGEHEIEESKSETTPDKETGYFQLDLEREGLVVYVGCKGYNVVKLAYEDCNPGLEIVLTKKGDREIKNKVDSISSLDEVEVEGDRIRKSSSGSISTAVENDWMISRAEFRIPFKLRKNMRVAAQALWRDRVDIVDETRDTVFTYGSATFHDKNEHRDTQLRRMDFDMERDSMYGITQIGKKRLDSLAVETNAELMSQISFMPDADTILVNIVDAMSGFDPDPSHPYPFGATVQIVDYNTVLYTEVFNNNGERSTPLKFLEFDFADFLPDSTEFVVHSRKVSNTHSVDLKLQFHVGSAILDERDTTNVKQLSDLRNTLFNIDEDEDRTLLDVRLTGMASPEGNFLSNKELAARRARTVEREVVSFIGNPNKVMTEEAKVAKWEWVADSLEYDGHKSIAQEIREITEKFPGNIAVQNSHISKIGSYGLVKEVYLPKFRIVRCEYSEKKNELKDPRLILEEYNKGKKLSRAEYFRLLHFIRNDKPLLKRVASDAVKNTYEKKYSRDSVYNYGHWAYAAAMLANAYVATDTLDMKLQEPFFSYRIEKVSEKQDTVFFPDINSKEKISDNVVGYHNSIPMAANQLIMTIKQHKRQYNKLAQVWECLIERYGEEYAKLVDISKCKRGLYRQENEEGKRIREVVMSISPTNAVVMNLAMSNPKNINDDYLLNAIKDTLSLPDKSASDYLKSIISLRRKEQGMAENYLANSFCKDIRMIAVANNDFDLIDVNDTDYHVITRALPLWLEKMKDNIKKANRKVSFNIVKKPVVKTIVPVNATDTANVVEQEYKLIKQRVVTEMSEEEYNKHPFAIFVKAFDSLTDKDNTNDGQATVELYNVFDKENVYLSIFEVFLVRDENIRKNKELLRKLIEVRNGYLKSA